MQTAEWKKQIENINETKEEAEKWSMTSSFPAQWNERISNFFLEK